MPDDVSPASTVQRQLDAYNSRDIDALLRIYTDDAELFEHPSKLVAAGSGEIRTRFVARFAEPNLHATLLQRIVVGPFVIDHETVTRTFSDGAGQIKLVMIYEVQAGRIARAWSIAGEKQLFPTPAIVEASNG